MYNYYFIITAYGCSVIRYCTTHHKLNMREKNIFPCLRHNFHHSNLNMTSRFENFIVNMQTLSDVYNFQTPPEYQTAAAKPDQVCGANYPARA